MPLLKQLAIATAVLDKVWHGVWNDILKYAVIVMWTVQLLYCRIESPHH